LETTHRKVVVSWYTQTILEISRHWNNAPITTAFGHSRTEEQTTGVNRGSGAASPKFSGGKMIDLGE